MAKYPFLSPGWIDAARAIRDDVAPGLASAGEPVRVNLLVTQVPFAGGEVRAHLETRPGLLELEEGHAPEAHTTVTIEYETARAIFVAGDMQAGMQAYMSGRIRVDGDVAKLITAFGVGGSGGPLADEVGARLRSITEGLDAPSAPEEG